MAIDVLKAIKSGMRLDALAVRVHAAVSIAKIPSALKPLTLASPAGRLPNHDGRTDFVVFVSEIRA